DVRHGHRHQFELHVHEALLHVRQPAFRRRRTSRYSSRRSMLSAAPPSIPDWSIPSRSSTVSNTTVVVSVVLPSRSSKATVWTETWPGIPSHSNVHVMRSGRTISRYSPRNGNSKPSEPRCTMRQAPPGRKSTSQLAISYLRGPHHC